MPYEIKVLDLIDIEVESSFLVLAHNIGNVTRAKCWSYLILGGEDAILVDTGVSSPEILARLGMTGYVKHHIDRLHKPGALRLLDLELSGPDEILPEIVCEVAGGHTEGSMNILVETSEGTACICGDIVYDVQNSLVEPYHVMLECEPQVTGNHGLAKRQERAAIKKALNSGRFL